MGKVQFYKIVYDTGEASQPDSKTKASRWFVQALLLVPILLIVHFSKLYIWEKYFNSSDSTKIDLYEASSKEAVLQDNLNLLKRELEFVRAELETLKERHLKEESGQSDSLGDYFADRVGALDYAAEYMGSSIVSILDTVPYKSSEQLVILGIFKWIMVSDPRFMLQRTNEAGNCFAFHGSKARIRIKLGAPVVITDFGVEHIKLPEGRKTALKDFEVVGLQNAKDESGISLGTFEYIANGKMLQIFPVAAPAGTSQSFQYLELRILTNYGGEFTCLYRFRVHSRIFNYD